MSSLIQLKGLLTKEVARFFKVPLQTIGTSLVNAVLYLMIFGVSLGNSLEGSTASSYLSFLIPGLIALSHIKNVFDNSTSAIIGPKYVNELQELRIVSMTIQQIAWSKSLASVFRGLIVSLITLIVGELFFYFTEGHFLSIAHPWILIYFLIVGGLAFGFLGIAIGMWAKTFEYIGAVSALILIPLIYLGGVFFTLNNLHPLWQKASLYNPLFYIINGMRFGVLDRSDVALLPAALITFSFFLFTYICSLISLKKGDNYLR